MSSEKEVDRKGIFSERKNPKPSVSAQSTSVHSSDKTKVVPSESATTGRKIRDRPQRIQGTRNRKKVETEAIAKISSNKNAVEELGSPWTKTNVRE